MNILVIGSGGREHAFCWKLAQSPRAARIYAAPGNPGTAQVAQNADLPLDDFPAIGQFVQDEKIDMVVCGPEAPLADGLADFFAQTDGLQDVRFVGPSKAAAQLEASKDFAKQFMLKYGIPTAESRTFTAEQFEDGLQFLQIVPPPYVLKADGLAAGKGVLVTQDPKQAQDLFKQMLQEDKFGAAASKVLVEQYLEGVELSVFVLADGQDYRILPAAKDYKRIGEGDAGLNTGGMGAISPVPFADPGFIAKVESKIIRPTFKGLKEEGIDYKGFLFIGLMNVDDTPYVIEYNCRMGDPETQAVLPRIDSDFVDLLEASANGALAQQRIKVKPGAAATVVLVSGGYPEAYQKGKAISGLEQDYEQATVFHAGTAQSDGQTVTAGGRVLALTGMGETFQQALEKAYAAAQAIQYEGKYYRKDLGQDLAKRGNVAEAIEKANAEAKKAENAAPQPDHDPQTES